MDRYAYKKARDSAASRAALRVEFRSLRLGLGGGFSRECRTLKPKSLTIGPVTLGGKTPAFILDPCVIESTQLVRRMARKISQICAAEDLPFIFKASYDKANRTSVRSYRGMGAREGCALLGQIGREIGMPVTTDVHSPNEAEIAAEFIDVLQIPAFLCRRALDSHP